MENITINQKQLFDVIKRTISLSEEYAIEKLDAERLKEGERVLYS